MMKESLESFANEVINVLETRFPHVFRNAEFHVQTVSKPGNVMLTGISIRLNGPVAPIFYVNSDYEAHRSAMDTAVDIAEKIANDMEIPQISAELITDWNSFASQNVVPRLISSVPGRNDQYLRERVKTRLCDGIAVIYDIVLPGQHADASMSVPVTRGLMHIWEVSPQQIHEAAIKNGPRLRPFKIASLASVLAEMMGIPFVPSELEVGPAMDILTVEGSSYGAAAILYPEVQRILAERYSNCCLLPSSICEWLIVDKSAGIEVNQLLDMVMSVNTNEVQPEDFLADDVLTLDQNGKLVSAIEGGRR